MIDRKIILASASPRRQELLRVLVPTFEVAPSHVTEETMTAGDTPAQYASHLAYLKAGAVAGGFGHEAIIIGADTIVVCDGYLMNKPGSAAEAVGMLCALSDRRHHVITGLCVIDRSTATILREHAVTEVHMRAITESEILKYVQSGEPLDKAGAYAIQGKAALFIDGIVGDYFNVVGLPLFTLGQMLAKIGFRCL